MDQSTPRAEMPALLGISNDRLTELLVYRNLALHWLPVKYRILFKVAILTFKILHGPSPDLVTTKKENSRYNLRSNKGLLLEIQSIKSKKTLGDRSFKMAAPSVWNNLPYNLQNETNFKKFKTFIYTIL